MTADERETYSSYLRATILHLENALRFHEPIKNLNLGARLLAEAQTYAREHRVNETVTPA